MALADGLAPPLESLIASSAGLYASLVEECRAGAVPFAGDNACNGFVAYDCDGLTLLPSNVTRPRTKLTDRGMLVDLPSTLVRVHLPILLVAIGTTCRAAGETPLCAPVECATCESVPSCAGDAVAFSLRVGITLDVRWEKTCARGRNVQAPCAFKMARPRAAQEWRPVRMTLERADGVQPDACSDGCGERAALPACARGLQNETASLARACGPRAGAARAADARKIGGTKGRLNATLAGQLLRGGRLARLRARALLQHGGRLIEASYSAQPAAPDFSSLIEATYDYGGDDEDAYAVAAAYATEKHIQYSTERSQSSLRLSNYSSFGDDSTRPSEAPAAPPAADLESGGPRAAGTSAAVYSAAAPPPRPSQTAPSRVEL